jgi:hypothetical protein
LSLIACLIDSFHSPPSDKYIQWDLAIEPAQAGNACTGEAKKTASEKAVEKMEGFFMSTD